MSADRYEIDMHDDGTFIITNLNGHRFIVDANCVDIRSRAIRQQARDIAELRTDLAAAVAERDSLVAAMARSCDAARNELYECQLAFDWRRRAEQAEARIAAIDAAPTVGWLRPYGRGLSTSEPSGERMPQYELIARPAKD